MTAESPEIVPPCVGARPDPRPRRTAVLAYADAVEATHPQLAADIRRRYGPQDSSTIPSEGP